MKQGKTAGAGKTSELRLRAEELMNANPAVIAGTPPTRLKAIIHELQIHQVELQLQNEELRQAQLDLARSRDRLNDLYDFAPVGYVTLDPKGKILEANLKAAEMLGVPRKKLLRRDFSEFVAREGQDRFYLHRQAVGDEGAAQTCELSLVRGDPAPWIARIESLPFVEPNTQEQLCHTALIDVTEQRKLEVKLRELTADLERRVAERTALAEERASQIQALAAELTQAEQHERDRVADLVHDNLQQLLVACRMRLSILARKAAKTERSELIADVSSLLKQAIAATRSLSVQLSPPVLPGENLVLSLRWLSDWMKANHELRVDLSLAAEAEPVQPATRLVCFQAVRELLLNVAKHAKVDQASVSMGLDSAGNTQITVRDEGAGYDPATPQNAEGSALGAGLAYLRRKLYLAGGQIDIESRPGHGTCARLRIPLHRGRPTTTDR